MATTTKIRHRELRGPRVATEPAYTAFWILRLGFGSLPIVAGVDKFLGRLVEWNDYLWPEIPNLLHVSAGDVLRTVGVMEIVAGLLVLFAPRFGAILVAAWLAGIVGNLVMVGIESNEYWDIALRDVGLFAGALALFFLARQYTAGLGRRERMLR